MTSLAEALDGVGEVEVDAQAARPDAAALVAHLLGGARGDVARGEVAEARVLALQVVVALVLGDLVRASGCRPAFFGHPDAAVVAERLAHQRQLGLVVARDRDAGRVDLGVAGVGEGGALACGPARWPWRCSPWRWSRGRRRCRSRRSPGRPRRRACDSISPVTRSRVTMPRARPSTTTRSSISVRGYISTLPRPICRSSAW